MLQRSISFKVQLAAIAPDFAWFDIVLPSLTTEVKSDDLDLIDRAVPCAELPMRRCTRLEIQFLHRQIAIWRNWCYRGFMR